MERVVEFLSFQLDISYLVVWLEILELAVVTWNLLLGLFGDKSILVA